MRKAAFAIVLALAASCSGTTAKRAGESCNASSECDTGLICDLNAESHVCSSGGAIPDAEDIDAPPGTDGPGLDGPPPDGRPPDARPPDARPPDARPPDARPPDAMIDAPMIDAAIDAP